MSDTSMLKLMCRCTGMDASWSDPLIAPGIGLDPPTETDNSKSNSSYLNVIKCVNVLNFCFKAAAKICSRKWVVIRSHIILLTWHASRSDAVDEGSSLILSSRCYSLIAL